MRDFIKGKKQFEKFLETIHINEGIMESQKVGILVCPWMNTAVPWYSITIGAILRRRGYKVALIVNDMWISCKYPIPYYKYKEQCKAILKLVKRNKIIQQYFDVIYLSQIEKAVLTTEDEAKLNELAQIATVRQFGSSGKAGTAEYEKATENWKNIFNEFYPNILSVLLKEQWKKIIIPGGLFLDSGLFFEAAKKNDVTIVTYDASPSSVFIGIDTCAARNGNVKEAVDILIEQNKGHELYEKALKILKSRKSGEKDIAPHMNLNVIQKCSYEEMGIGNSYDVVIFMNVENDTAALGTHSIFQNDLDWISETVKYILEKTNLTVAIREHPLQRLFGESELSSKIKELKTSDRVCFFNYDDDVNSYRLIEASKAIVVCTSTVGLEAAMYGKSVILESDCYYGGAKCIKQAKTKEQYFQSILDAVDQPMHMTQAEKEEVGVYYYLTQLYGSVRNGFSAQPSSFEEGIKEPFDRLCMREDVKIQIDCMIEEKPLCLALYQRDYGKGI